MVKLVRLLRGFPFSKFLSLPSSQLLLLLGTLSSEMGKTIELGIVHKWHHEYIEFSKFSLLIVVTLLFHIVTSINPSFPMSHFYVYVRKCHKSFILSFNMLHNTHFFPAIFRLLMNQKGFHSSSSLRGTKQTSIMRLSWMNVKIGCNQGKLGCGIIGNLLIKHYITKLNIWIWN